MSNAFFAIGQEESVPSMHVFMEKDEMPTSYRTSILMWKGRRPSSEHVLNGIDRAIQTLVFVLLEEVVNQYLGMAFYGSVFIAGETSVRAKNHEAKSPFLVRTMMDFGGHWRIMGFSWYSISHVLMFYIRQCFGH